MKLDATDQSNIQSSTNLSDQQSSPGNSAVTPVEVAHPSPLADYAPFSKRALLIGVILCPLLIFWAEYTEIVAQGADLIAMSLVMAVMFAFIVMLSINGIVRKFAPERALTQAEMMFIYVMNSASIGIAGIGM